MLGQAHCVRTIGVTGLHEQMLAYNKFLWAHQDFYNVHGHQKEWQLWKRLLKDQEGYRVEDSDEPLDKEETIRMEMIPGAESVGILELDMLIKMPMPDEDPEEEVEKEIHWQATAHMRAYRWSRGEEVESDAEMYEDLEPLLVQEVELEENKEKREKVVDVDIAGLSGTKAS